MKKCNKIINKVLTIFLIFNIAITNIFANEQGEEIEDTLAFPEITADAYMLISQDDELILAEHNIDSLVYPASTTKIMTAILVLENAELTETETMTSEMYNLIPVGSSHAAIDRNETLTVEDLLYCLMLPSGNEAAIMLAYHVAGNIENFSVMMNEKAMEIGATNTNFVNPHGFHDENHYTTTSDMAKITLYACQNEMFNEISNTAQKTISATNTKSEPRIVYTTNKLIYRTSDSRYYEYAKGIKSGYTSQAGYCLIASAENDSSEKLISLIFNAKLDEDTNESRLYTETKELFEWGFNNFEKVELIDLSKPMHELPVRLSVESDYVLIQPTSAVVGILPIDYNVEDIVYDYNIPESLTAPVLENEIVGTVNVYYDGTFWGTSELVAINSLELSDVLYWVDQIENFFDSSLFKIVMTTIIVLFVLGVAIRMSKIRAKNKKTRRNVVRKQKARPKQRNSQSRPSNRNRKY